MNPRINLLLINYLICAILSFYIMINSTWNLLRTFHLFLQTVLFYNSSFFPMLRMFRSSLSNFQIYTNILLIVVTTLHIRSSKLSLITVNLRPLTYINKFSPPPSPWQLPFYFLFLWNWLISVFSIVSPRFIHVVANNKIFFFIMTE